jgi:aromatic-L-amino-acid/L-tryptophan decarboxylase
MVESEDLKSFGDMPKESFRETGHRLIDWIAEYLESVEDYSVLSEAKPGEIANALADGPTTEGESFDKILDDFENIILPGITHWNHPKFFGYFSITGSGPGILGELLASALNVNGMLWRTSPSATELERKTLDWFRRMVGLPESFWGILYDTASVSTMHAVAAAREAVPGQLIREKGMAGRADLRPLILYTSENAHSSVEKAAIVLGVGLENVRKIRLDELGRMDAADLRSRIVTDRETGSRPFCAVATIGTTSTTAVDPVREIAALCAEHEMWLHVDAAYAGPAAVLPEMRPLFEGWEQADSIVINPHKWLFTPLDCSAFYTRRPDVLRRAFQLVPEYLRSPGTEAEGENLMDYGMQLGRRFRSLKLWFVLRYFGLEGIRSRLREHVRLARHFAGWIDEHPDFERMAPTPFSTVCFRAHPEDGEDAGLDGLNERLLASVNGTGECFLSHTKINGAFCLRMAIGNLRTEERHVHDTWVIIQHALKKSI